LDATTCDILSKTSEHPIYLTLGNIPNWRRCKVDAKVLLAYLPRIKETNEYKNQKDYSITKHYLFQHLLEVLIEPIRSGGFDLYTDDDIIWCYPFLSELLGDMPEHHSFTLTYSSPNCNMPCYACITLKDEFNNPLIDHSTIQLHTPAMMQNVLKNGDTTKYSLHNMKNVF
jgi:hypothetical protein